MLNYVQARYRQTKLLIFESTGVPANAPALVKGEELLLALLVHKIALGIVVLVEAVWQKFRENLSFVGILHVDTLSILLGNSHELKLGELVVLVWALDLELCLSHIVELVAAD